MGKAINFKVNPIYHHIASNFDDYEIIVNQGGTRSGKTYNTIIFLITLAYSRPGHSISVVSQSVPHLKKGAHRDFVNIMKSYSLYEESRHNKSDREYHFPNGSYIEFFSADDDGKVRGPSRDTLFINEINANIAYEVYRQLLIRTRGNIVCDFNPVEPEHWIYDKVIGQPETKLLVSTYKDNLAFLEEKQVNSIIREGEKDPNFKRVFVDGKRGTYIIGQVFPEKWHYINEDALPDYEVFYGLDFGFSVDPTAVVKIITHNDKLYLHEVLYETELTNRDIAYRLQKNGAGNNPVYCDSAEPKSIEELKRYGINAFAAYKGQGSINSGIKQIKKHIVYLTDTSRNIKKEKLYYKYKIDDRDKPASKPIDNFNHAMDAIRYGLISHKKQKKVFVL